MCLFCFGNTVLQIQGGIFCIEGEKAIRILAPAPYKIKEERDQVDPVTQEIMLDRDGNP